MPSGNDSNQILVTDEVFKKLKEAAYRNSSPESKVHLKTLASRAIEIGLEQLKKIGTIK